MMLDIVLEMATDRLANVRLNVGRTLTDLARNGMVVDEKAAMKIEECLVKIVSECSASITLCHHYCHYLCLRHRHSRHQQPLQL
jgi:hypothetical protein